VFEGFDPRCRTLGQHFDATIVEALGREPERPARFAGIEGLPKRVTVLPADVQAVKGFIASHCG